MRMIASLVAVAALALAGCSDSPGKTGGSQTTATADANDSKEGNSGGEKAQRKEVSSLKPRLVVSYDGGLLTLEGATGKVLADVKKGGFLRLNPAGDGRHVVVSDGDVFRLFDVGLIAQRHEDHYHYYVASPRLTSAQIKAPKAGHVVNHAGRTSLFSDGDGTVQTFAADALKDGKLDPSEIKAFKGGDAHHGVAVPLSNGNMLTTKGTEKERHTIQEVYPSGKVVAETTDCPGVQGEAAAQCNAKGYVFSCGCTNGPVVYRDGAFHKIPVSEPYQRSGNQFGSPESPYVLADYKTVKPAEGAEGVTERPTSAGVIDTASGTLKKVALGSPYWFRSFARGPNGEGLVLTYDGNLAILDPASGEVKKKVKVVKEWREKDDWQEPGPNVTAIGDYAYVSEPASKKIHLVQISTGEIVTSFNLKVVPNEMSAASGKPDAGSKK